MKLKKGNQRIFLLQWLAKSDPVAPSDLLLPFGNQEIKLLAFAPNLCCPSPDLMGLELVIMHMTSQLLFLECSLANFEVQYKKLILAFDNNRERLGIKNQTGASYCTLQ